MERRGSLSALFGGLSLAMSSEGGSEAGEIDWALRGSLYPQDPALLEKRCADSMNAEITQYGMPAPAKKVVASSKQRLKDEISPKSYEEVVEGLKIDYYTPNYDPLEDHLLEISSWNDEYGSDKDTITELFMNKIEATDVDKDVIIGLLTTKIDENYDDLMSCINNVKSVSEDLTQAGQLIRRSRRRISGASTVIQSGAIKIRTLQQRREKLEDLAETLRSVKALQDVHRGMVSSIQTGEVGRAAELASSVLTCLRTHSYESFKALKGIRDSMQKSIFVIRQKTDKALKRLCCRNFAPLEYEKIVQSYLALDELSESVGVALYDPDEVDEDDDGEDDAHMVASGCIEGLANRIYRFQLRDIDVWRRSAVMDVIYAAQQKKHKAAAELDVVGVYTTMSNCEVMEMTEMPLHDLYRHLTATLLGPCVVRSCELLADAVHTHYLITQWHCTPFDERNCDLKFLHRCSVDLTSSSSGSPRRLPRMSQDSADGLSNKSRSASNDYDTLKDSLDEDEELIFQRPKAAAGHLNGGVAASSRRPSDAQPVTRPRKPSSALDRYLASLDGTGTASEAATPKSKARLLLQTHGGKLRDAYDSLATCRSLLWEELQRSLVDMLNLMSFNSAVKSDDYLSMVWALNGMVTLGKEFCGSESDSLRRCLEEKSKEYFSNFHMESFNTLRQMLQEDCWQSMPLSQTALRQMGGVLGIIKSHCPRDAIGARLLRQHCSGSDSGAGSGGTGASGSGSGSASLQTRLRRSSIRYINQDKALSTASISADSEYEQPHSAEVARAPSILMLFEPHGNPFHFMTNEDRGGGEGQPSHERDSGFKDTGAASKARDALDDTDGFWQIMNDDRDLSSGSCMHMIVTQSALNGLSKYTANYLHMMYILPSKASEIFNSLMQLFDFYFCTVFMGFVPPDERTKFLTKPTKMTAPAPDQSRDFEALFTYLERTLDSASPSTTAPAPQRAKRLSVRRVSLLSSSSLGASPTSPSLAAGEEDGDSSPSSQSQISSAEAAKLASLLTVPDVVSAGDFSNMYSLYERIVAAESCFFVAKILAEVKPKILKLGAGQNIESCEETIAQFQTIGGQLRSLVYRSACPSLIRQNTIMPQIVEHSGWDAKKLRESNHDWVDKLVASGKEIWEFLLQTDQFAESTAMVREQVWMEVSQCIFDLVMEGYSQVRKVSPEGRSAMTMDVFALHDGLNSIHLCRPPRGKHHVDNFLRAAYMSDDEMMQWLHENWRQYSYKHMSGLLTQTLSSAGAAAALLAAGGVGGGSRRLKEAKSILDGLYEIIDPSIGSAAAGQQQHPTRRSSILNAITSSTSAASSVGRSKDKDRDPSDTGGGQAIANFSNPISQLMPQFSKR